MNDCKNQPSVLVTFGWYYNDFYLKKKNVIRDIKEIFMISYHVGFL